MSKAFPQKHVKEPSEIIFFIKNRVAERSNPKVTEGMASLALEISLTANVQHLTNKIKSESKSCLLACSQQLSVLNNASKFSGK